VTSGSIPFGTHCAAIRALKKSSPPSRQSKLTTDYADNPDTDVIQKQWQGATAGRAESGAQL
jgi:hypothetical protein